MSINTKTKALVAETRQTLRQITCYNINAVDVWVYLYDKKTVGAVTVGTTPYKYRILVPAGSGAFRGASGASFDFPLVFDHGVVVGVIDVDDTPPDENLELDIFVKEYR